MRILDGENGKSFRIGEHEGMAYLWIIRPSGKAWTIKVPMLVFRNGARSGTFAGESDLGRDRRLRIQAGPQTTKIRIHHADDRSGLDITVNSARLEHAINEEYRDVGIIVPALA